MQSGAAPIPPTMPSPQPTLASPQTLVFSTPPSGQQDGQKTAASNSLLAGGIVGSAIIIGLVYRSW